MKRGGAEKLNEKSELFFRDCVDSYEKLDVLLYVHRRGEPIHPRDIARALGLSLRDVQRALEGLCDSGVLVQQTSDHVCEPGSDALRAELADFARGYREQPLTILSVLSRQLIARQRASSGQRVRHARHHAVRHVRAW